MMRRIFLMILGAILLTATPTLVAQELQLKSVAEIRALSLAEAVTNPTVNLRLQVLKIGAKKNGAFVSDGKDGIYLAFTHSYRGSRSFRAGEILDVYGKVAPGRFLPHISAVTIKRQGFRALPAPRKIDESKFADPSLDAQWVSFSGTILDVIDGTNPQELGFRIQCGEKTVNALVSRSYLAEQHLASLMHYRVKIRAIASTKANEKGQMIARYFSVSQYQDIKVIPEKIEAVTAMDQLLRRGGDHEDGVKVRGRVLYANEREIYLRGEKASVYVKARNDHVKVERGALLEIEGQVQTGPVRPIILANQVSIIETGPELEPVNITLTNEGYHSSLSDELVTLEAQVRGIRENNDGYVIQCEGHEIPFDAHIDSGITLPANLQRGATIRLTGICKLTASRFFLPFPYQMDGFRLRVRDLGDLEILQAPSWWSARRLAITLGGIAAIGVLAFVWAMLLRSQVASQTNVISAQVQREAAHEERQRLARELHDTLQQNMTGISMQLDHARRHLDASQPDLTKDTLNRAQSMLDQCRQETRESISQLRSATTTRGSLAILVEDAMREEAEMHAVTLKVETAGKPYPLDPFYVRHAVRITREAFSNALSHSKASKVRVNFVYSDEELEVQIEDNGAGFETQKAPPKGHFGLVGMKERAARIGSKLSINSEPGRGTMIDLKIPRSLSIAKEA